MDKPIKKFTFLKERKLIERLDVYPYIFIHSFAIIFYANSNINPIFKLIIFSLIVIAQGITFFSKFWFDNILAKICYKVVTSLKESTHIKVDVISEKFKMNNRTAICEIKRKDDVVSIEFEKILLVFDNDKNTFVKPKLDLKGKKLKELLKCEPLTETKISNIRNHYGENRMKIPIPSFFSLYKEHIVAPFFVFQLFCILLLIFDDYGLHSFITLFMLCVFEATVVGQRIFNLATLRKMRVPPHKIFVYRDKKWIKIPSNMLLPGDIVSVVEGSNYETVEEEEDDETKNNMILKLLKTLKEAKKKAEERRNQKSVNTVLNKHKEKEPSPLTCDMLLLAGSAIVNEAMLTGESVPQIKDSIRKLDNEYEKEIDLKLHHKKCVLYAGTKVVKVSRNEDIEQPPEGVECPPPDKGCICMVIKTGFSTSQGKLLRTVMYSSERNKGDSKEAFIFIAVLLVIALAASYYVLIDGLEREGELTYKLLLRCIIIITSVVPAELPIELSLAINNSLFFLQGKRIVCIEPFRIPFAGKIDICCFDKTGTLTRDEFIMKGLVSPKVNTPTKSIDTDEGTLSVLLGCNSLISINNKPVGDPIEVAMFKDAEGKLEGDNINCQRKTKIYPIRKYQFDSELKRMTVLARVSSGVYDNKKYNRVLCKGAPEVIKGLLKEVPEGYDECFNKWAKLGYRILALGYRDDDSLTYGSKREELEKDLTFAGFAIVETPLKPKVEQYIAELIKAEYDVCIITGDHFLTTSKVSKDLKLGPEKFAFLKIENDKKVNWFDLDNNMVKETKDVNEIKELAKTYTLGMTGKEMENLEALAEFKDKHMVFQYIKLFCRVSPTQKDDIIKHMIKSGRNPSMCGDGSNDVGALKRAVIGIALLNIEETEHQKKQQFNILSFDDETTIKQGDVTSAAPFTSKSPSIKCVKNIFIQGRCTLVVSFQMYKILALNCLLNAYSLSVLALKGVKYSDYQALYMGFAVAIFFMMLSKATPLKKLNRNKPPSTIFTVDSIVSIIGQAVVSLASMLAITYYTKVVDPVAYGEVKSLDDDFTPTLMNTIMFIYSFINQTITLVVNYMGEPFMENMTKNPTLNKMVIGIVGFCLVVIFDIYPPLNEALELLPLPEDMMYKCSLVGIMALNWILCYLFENWKKLLGYYKDL